MNQRYVITKIMDYQHKLDEKDIKLNSSMIYTDIIKHTKKNGEYPLGMLEKIIDYIIEKK